MDDYIGEKYNNGKGWGLQKECKVSHQIRLPILQIQDDYTNFLHILTTADPTLYQLTNKNVNKNNKNNNNNNIHFMSYITKWARTRVVKKGVCSLIYNTLLHRGLSGTVDWIIFTLFICMYLKAEIIVKRILCDFYFNGKFNRPFRFTNDR